MLRDTGSQVRCIPKCNPNAQMHSVMGIFLSGQCVSVKVHEYRIDCIAMKTRRFSVDENVRGLEVRGVRGELLDWGAAEEGGDQHG